jgi:hypothetical protein
VSFILYYFNIWSAGDGKLFFVYAALLPLGFYSSEIYYPFPSFNLIVNLFIPFFLFIIIKYLLLIKKDEVVTLLKNTLDIKKIFFICIGIFLISWVIQIGLSYLNISNTFLNYSLAFIVFGQIKNLKKNNEKLILILLIILSVIRILFDRYVLTARFLSEFLAFLFIIIIINSFVDYALKKSIIYVKSGNLKEGMALNYDELKKEIKILYDEKAAKNHPLYSLNKNVVDKEFIEISKNRKDKLNQKLKFPVYERIAFAHILFIGVIITIITKGNILIFIANLIR